jgi:hypothetical protein
MHTKLLSSTSSSSSEEEEEEAEKKSIHDNSSSISSYVYFCFGFVYKCWYCGEELAGKESFQNGGEMREAKTSNTVVVL